MIKAIRDLGFFELKEVSGKEIFDIKEFEEVRRKEPQLIAKLIAEKATAKTGVIKVYALKIENGKLSYELDETVYKGNNPPRDDKDKSYRDYLFKEPRSTRGEEKGTYISFSFKLVDTSAGKLFGYIKNLRSVLNSNNAPQEIKEFFKLVDRGKDTFKKEIDKVFDKIKKQIDIKKNFVMITIKPDGKNLSEHEVLTNDFIKRFLDECRYPQDKVPENYNPKNQKGQCSVCLRENQPLLGYLRPYNFFTVDKIGFYPSFKNYESWKYFPVCESCGILIQAGKNFMGNYFKAIIAGYNVLVILKNKELIEKQKRFVDLKSIKSFRQIADIEKHLIKKLPELTIVESYNFMFYKEKQNQFEILNLIPDVLPSRIKKIVDSIKEIKERFEHSNWFDLDKVQKNKGDWRIDTDFYFLKESVGETVDFPKVEYSPTKVKVLNLIQSAFTGQLISYREIISEISSKLQFVFKQSLNFDSVPVFKLAPYVFSGAGTIEFLKEVKVMESEVTETKSCEGYPEKLKEIFEKHKVFFDTAQKRACFLVGVLYGKLEGKQTALDKKGASLGWLRSLDLRWEYLTKELYPRIHLKFKEYDQIGEKKAAFTEEAKILFDIASYEFSGCENEEMPREEIPFYFTLGWTTYKRFFSIKEESETKTKGD